MRVLDRREIKLQLSDLTAQSRLQYERGLIEPRARSRGVHVSGILKAIGLELIASGQVAKEQLSREDFEEEFPLRMAIGMAWEQWAQALWPEMVWQPGKYELGGIAGSPDGLTKDFNIPFDGGIVHTRLLEEFKFTWKSSRNRHNSITGEWLWTRQVMSYCKLMGLRYARLHVLWCNGQWDFKVEGGFQPHYYTYLIEFKQEEIDKNWQLLVSNKDKAVAEE